MLIPNSLHCEHFHQKDLWSIENALLTSASMVFNFCSLGLWSSKQMILHILWKSAAEASFFWPANRWLSLANKSVSSSEFAINVNTFGVSKTQEETSHRKHSLGISHSQGSKREYRKLGHPFTKSKHFWHRFENTMKSACSVVVPLVVSMVVGSLGDDARGRWRWSGWCLPKEVSQSLSLGGFPTQDSWPKKSSPVDFWKLHPRKSNIDTKNCLFLRELPLPNHRFGYPC